MKSYFISLFISMAIVACEPINDPNPPCDCEQDFTILLASNESTESNTSSPEWEIEVGEDKPSDVRVDASSHKHSKRVNEEKQRNLPFSLEEQKKLALISGFYKTECLALCNDGSLSVNHRKEMMRYLIREAKERAWDILNEDRVQRKNEPPQPSAIYVKTQNPCVEEQGIKLYSNKLTVYYRCPERGRNFRLVATAILADGTRETSPSFLTGKLHPSRHFVQFDLSKLNWKHLSSKERIGLKIEEARISIPVKSGGEKAVATIFF